MNIKKLPFEPTYQILRYLKEITESSIYFLSQKTGEIVAIESYEKQSGEEATLMSEYNNCAFWKYLVDIKAIELPKTINLKNNTIAKKIESIENDKPFEYLKKIKVKVLDMEKIVGLSVAILDAFPSDMEYEDATLPLGCIAAMNDGATPEVIQKEENTNIQQIITKKQGGFYYLDKLIDFGENTQYKDLFDIIFSSCIQNNFISYEKINTELLSRKWKEIPQKQIKKRIQNAITNGIFRFAKIGNKKFENVNQFNKRKLLKIRRGQGIEFNNYI